MLNSSDGLVIETRGILLIPQLMVTKPHCLNTTKINIPAYVFNRKPGIAEFFFCLFVEQPLVLYLDQCEDKWAVLTGATINIEK